MPKQYRVTMRVQADLIGPVIELLADRGVLEKCEEITEAVQPEKKHHYLNGKRDKGIKGRDLVLSMLSDNNTVVSYNAICKAFKDHGFAETSVGPTLSGLVNSNLVKRLPSGSITRA